MKEGVAGKDGGEGSLRLLNCVMVWGGNAGIVGLEGEEAKGEFW